MRNTVQYLGTRIGTASLAFGLAVEIAAALAPPARAQNFTLGYSTGFLQDPFQVIQADNVIASGRKSGFKTLPVANANGDPGKQISDFHNLIAEGAQGILFVARDSEAIVPALDFAASKNVPAVFHRHGPRLVARRQWWCAPTTSAWARMPASLPARHLAAKVSCCPLMGDQATLNGRDRTSGFSTCIKKDFSDIKLIEQPTYWATDKATSIAQTVVTSTPNLGAIYMQSDAVMLAGVLNVLKSAGRLKPVGEPGHIFLVSIDGTPLAMQKIREKPVGRRNFAAAEPLCEVGSVLPAECGCRKDVCCGAQPTTTAASRCSTANPMDMLPAPTVTKANVDDPALWANAAKS